MESVETMKVFEANKAVWTRLSEAHSHWFKKALSESPCRLTASSTFSAMRGAIPYRYPGWCASDQVDLAPENSHFAKKLAEDFSPDTRFIESDIMTLKVHHHEPYGIVFTSEGATGWPCDRNRWAGTIHQLLKDAGFFYLNEAPMSHGA